MNDLFKRIAEEEDAFIFRQLVEILDELLARKAKRALLKLLLFK